MSFGRVTLFGIIAMAWSSVAASAPLHRARYVDNGAGSRRVVYEDVIEGPDQTGLRETSVPQFIVEHGEASQAQIVELTATDASALAAALKARGVAPLVEDIAESAADEVVTLVDNGPVANRIDLVFMGDGYTQAQRELFFQDMQRLVDDMFSGDTFHSQLPLFNVHAVFRASNVSGIGVNDTPRDTAYGLNRAGNTLRAIYPGKPDAARASCRAAPGCDYPVIIGNDPFYGGLGGEFAISTSSPTSGTKVLRHELGHTFGRIGEEYDGGGYFGANFSRTLAGLSWKPWTTDSDVKAEPAAARFLAWPWKNLSSGAYTTTFRSDGQLASTAIRFSASGVPGGADSLTVTLDGAALPFTGPGTIDRQFHDLVSLPPLTAGEHRLSFAQTGTDNDNWLSNLTVHEFGAGYHFSNDFIGAFPLFNEDGSVAGYRSNDEACLMRNMDSTAFCPICQQNNWQEFLAKISLIDSVAVDTSDGALLKVAVATLELGQLRPGAAISGERLEVKWFRAGQEVDGLRDQFSWELPATDNDGSWTVEVRLVTPEVRQDPQGRLVDRKTFTVPG